MAVSEQRITPTEFVQHWVNSLPAVCEAEQRRSSLLSSSCSSCSSSGYERNQHGSYSLSYGGSPGHKASSHAAVERTPSDAIAGTSSAERNSPSNTAADKRQALRRKDSRLSWMHSNYSSFNSETSSIDLLLEERKGNPEQVLMNLGFGVEDKTIAARLPSRFLSQRTSASGIDMENFIRGHPELNRYMATETALAMGELYSRLPQYYRQVTTNEQHTSLHKQFSTSSLDLHSDQSSVPLTLHKNDDGTVFASILTKSNTEQLVKQGFYSEHSAQAPSPSANQSSVSSISTHDCTIDSVDVPSPIVLNNSVSSEPRRNPFISSQSSGSDSVFSSSESFTADSKLRSKLEAIREKTLQEISDEDLEEGISFVSRRRSDSDLIKHPDIVVQTEPEEKCSVHKKRKAFSRKKSCSFDEERLSQMLKDQLPDASSPHPTCATTPVIVTTGTSEDESSEPFIPKQDDNMLQVNFNPESFDSIDSDTGTLVPSPYASPYQGMSPNTSRNNSLSVLPAMESFELEEVQSCNESNTAHSSLQRRRARLQRSVSERSDSDSSGIADIDCKSSHGQSDNPASKASSNHLELPSPNKSLSSSNQTLSSVSSSRTAGTCKTLLPVSERPRRSSDSDASNMKYKSVSSNLQTRTVKPSIATQTPDYSCPCCGSMLDGSLPNQSRVIKEWQINNLPYINDLNITSGDNSMITDMSGSRLSSTGGRETDSCTKSSSDLESAGYSSDEFNGTSPSEQDRRVDEICSEMTRDLAVLKELIAKYGISTKEIAPTSSERREAVRQELASNVQVVKSVLLPDSRSTRSDSSISSTDNVIPPTQPHTSRQHSPVSPSHHDQTFPPSTIYESPDQRSRSPSYVPRVAVNGLSPGEGDSLLTPNSYRRSASPLLTSQSTCNSYAHSSVSSSFSRLSDQLKLTERKCEYESVASEETGRVGETEISAGSADER